jgi:hypothetical protein
VASAFALQQFVKRFFALIFEDCAEFRVGSVFLGKIIAEFLSKRPYQRVAIFATDFPVVVPVPIV